MLVTEFVDAIGFDEITVSTPEVRDRVGEIVYRFYCGLIFRNHEFPATRIRETCCYAPTAASRSSISACSNGWRRRVSKPNSRACGRRSRDGPKICTSC